MTVRLVREAMIGSSLALVLAACSPATPATSAAPGAAPTAQAVDAPRTLLVSDDAPPAGGSPPMDHGAMNHGAMDHSKMDHGAMGHATPGPAEPLTPDNYTFHTRPGETLTVRLPAKAGETWSITSEKSPFVSLMATSTGKSANGDDTFLAVYEVKASGNANVVFERKAPGAASAAETRTVHFMVH